VEQHGYAAPKRAGAGEGITTNYYKQTTFFATIAYTEPTQVLIISGLGRKSAQILHSGQGK
jgi:hypothetical protein